MVIKEIAKLCSKTKMVQVANVKDGAGVVTQWIGDSYGYYPLHGLPVMDKDAIMTMLDVPANERNTYGYGEIDFEQVGINIADMDRREEHLVRWTDGVAVYNDTDVLDAMMGSTGLWFTKIKYYRPLKDLHGDIMTYLRQRTVGGGGYLVVKAGMLVVAVMQAYTLGEEYYKHLLNMVDECRRVLMRNGIDPDDVRRARDAEQLPGQMRMDAEED